MKHIKFKKLRETAKLPIYSTLYSAGMDLCYDGNCGERGLFLEPHQVYLVGTGIALDLSDETISNWGMSMFLDLRLRSSLRAKGMTSLGSGVIDLDYRDEIKVVLMNLSTECYTLKQGDRIAQLIPIRHERWMIDVETKENPRLGGFGSTNVFN